MTRRKPRVDGSPTRIRTREERKARRQPMNYRLPPTITRSQAMDVINNSKGGD